MRTLPIACESISALALAIVLVIGASIGFLIVPELRGEPADGMASVRKHIEAIAVPAFREWAQSQPDLELQRFGFPSRAAADSARLLTPIPVVVPRQDQGQISIAGVETILDAVPTSWTVPVSVDGKIVALVGVEIPKGGEPKVVAYGKTYAANRLQAGIRALGSPSPDVWSRLRLVSFPGPRLDFLAARSASGVWTWWQLSGTEYGDAARLNPRELQAILDAVSTTNGSVQ